MSSIRMLMPFELHKYRDHLLHLGADDRRLRFGALLDDARIEMFVDGIDPRYTRVLAQLGADLEVVAAVHISILRRAAVEFAFTVNAAYRRTGIGTALITRAVLWSRNRRFTRAYVNYLPENTGMRRLARRAGMAVVIESGEMEAFVALPAASPLSYAAEALAESAGFMDFAAKAGIVVQERMGASVPRAMPARRA